MKYTFCAKFDDEFAVHFVRKVEHGFPFIKTLKLRETLNYFLGKSLEKKFLI